MLIDAEISVNEVKGLLGNKERAHSLVLLSSVEFSVCAMSPPLSKESYVWGLCWNRVLDVRHWLFERCFDDKIEEISISILYYSSMTEERHPHQTPTDRTSVVLSFAIVCDDLPNAGKISSMIWFWIVELMKGSSYNDVIDNLHCQNWTIYQSRNSALHAIW
jgi:hypothetical protein